LAIERARGVAPLLEVSVPDKPKIYNSDGWTLGVPLSLDVNLIDSDINLDNLRNQIRSGQAGTSVGVTFGYRSGGYEFESGLKYSRKRFNPGRLTNYTNISNESVLESSLDHLDIKQIQIPLLMKFHGPKPSKINVYAMAGLTFNAILINEYVIRRSIQPKANFRHDANANLVDFRRLSRGLSDGGTLKNNLYVSAAVGFGISSQVNPLMSWYVQPQYQHSFLVQLDDIVGKINVLSIEAGFKFRL